MWLECSECGDLIECDEHPHVCETCGTAGSIFVHAEDPSSDYQPDSVHAWWIEAGIERARCLLEEADLADT